jgi:protein kinase A
LQDKAPQQPQPLKEKIVNYSDPGVKIGQGKYGPVDLIIYNNEFMALKRIPKISVDSIKRIEMV